jgi:hypothetical protein
MDAKSVRGASNITDEEGVRSETIHQAVAAIAAKATISRTAYSAIVLAVIFLVVAVRWDTPRQRDRFPLWENDR